MIRTIEDIKKLKDLGKKKWGRSLLEFLKPYINDGLSHQEIVDILSTKFDLCVDIHTIKFLRRYYKTDLQRMVTKTDLLPTLIVTNQKNTVNNIVQKHESEKIKISVDTELGDDFTFDDLIAIIDGYPTSQMNEPKIMLNPKGAQF